MLLIGLTTPAFAASILLSGPLHLTVQNDGTGPAQFQITAQGGQAYATIRPQGGAETYLPVDISWSGTLSQDAVSDFFGGFVHVNEETIDQMSLLILDGDGHTVFGRSGAWDGRLNRTWNIFFPDTESRIMLRGNGVGGGGFQTDYLAELGLPHRTSQVSVSADARGAPQDIGGIVNDSLTSFDVALDRLVVFAAIPEPSTWSVTILGVGAAGALLRRRRVVAA